MLDVRANWQIGPFLVEANIQGEAGPWLTSEDVHRRYSPFVASDPPPDLHPLRLQMTTDWDAWPRDGEVVPSLELRAEPPHRWHMRRSDLWAHLDRTPGQPMSVTGAMAPGGLVIEECLRLMMWLSLATPGTPDGLLVHSSCTVHDGRAHCFPAHSGTGKSTLARLTPGDLALNDELALLTRREGRWFAWPVPFWNWQGQADPDVDPQTSFPVASLGLLAQAPMTRWEPLAPGEALFPLMEQVVAFPRFPEASGRTFELAADLVESTSVNLGRLHLRKGDAPYDHV